MVSYTYENIIFRQKLDCARRVKGEDSFPPLAGIAGQSADCPPSPPTAGSVRFCRLLQVRPNVVVGELLGQEDVDESQASLRRFVSDLLSSLRTGWTNCRAPAWPGTAEAGLGSKNVPGPAR
jgi:hypothetical protein